MGQIRFMTAVGGQGLIKDQPDDIVALKEIAMEAVKNGIHTGNDKGGIVMMPTLIEYTVGTFTNIIVPGAMVPGGNMRTQSGSGNTKKQ